MVKSAHRSTGSSLDIVPLGGLGEFGKNMMTYRLDETMVVVDAGIMFPGVEHAGVDFILPDTRYVDEYRKALQGIIITHAHEDHIGALPYVAKGLGVPVYGTKLTIAMIRKRLAEHDLLDDIELVEVTPGENFSIGAFGVEMVHVTHSLADAVAVVLETPFGKILHTGDFKVDDAPPVGPPIDLKRLAALGDEDVLCMLSDSTNAEVPGRTGAESSVAAAFDELVRDAPARVLLSCFTSSTHRIQVAIDTAVAHGRKVALLGRSMVGNVQTAIDVGYLRVPAGVLWATEDLDSVPRSKQLVITAGSQGEQLSALSQIANDTHRYVKLEPGDRVILSSRLIPGNERAINRVVNRLFRLGADVVQPGDAQVHVSGHGSAEDLDMVLRMVKPKSFIPIHGEWRQLFHHAKLARESGVNPDDVFLAEDGDVVRVDSDGVRMVDHFDLEHVLLDGSGLGLVEDCVVRDRRRLAATGVVVPMVSLSPGRRPQVSDILSRGFIENEDAEALLSEAHDVMLAAIERLSENDTKNENAIEDLLESTLKRFFRKRGIRRPVILPVVVESEEES
ncbi:MAG: ribonuclease J [Acidobacteriota bacterium]|nr:MAG: ribonuclease J [Acidobacteriota bacterium]